MFGFGITTRQAKRTYYDAAYDLVTPTMASAEEKEAASRKAQALIDQLESIRNSTDGQRADFNRYRQSAEATTHELSKAVAEIKEEIANLDLADHEKLHKVLTEVEGHLRSNTNLSVSGSATAHSLNLTGLTHLKPDHFNGSGDATAWIETFEHFTQLLHWSDPERVMGFPLFLRGAALSWFQGISKTQKDTWEHLKDAFAIRYEGKGNKWIKARELQHRKLLPGESLDSYTDDIRRWSRDLDLPDHIILGAYIEGLPAQIRQIVWQGMPDTFEQAEKAAQNAVKMFQLEGRDNSLASLALNDSMATKVDQGFQKLEVLLCQILDDRRPSVARSGNSGATARSDRNTKGRPVCYGCGFSGHILRDCKLKNVKCYKCGQFGHVKSRCLNGKLEERYKNSRPQDARE